MLSRCRSVALVWCATVVTALLLWSGGRQPRTRRACTLAAVTRADSDEARWEPTEALAASRRTVRPGDLRLFLWVTARGAVLSGSIGDREPLEPEVYDPATRRWAHVAGPFSNDPAAQLPARPTAHHRVIPCGAGCFLALPASADAAAGVASPDRSPQAPVFVFDGAWRPAGTVPVFFHGWVLAARTPRRLAVVAANTYFRDALHAEWFSAWVREGDAAWSASSIDGRPPGDASRIAATPSGAVVAVDGERFGVIRLPAGPAEGDGRWWWRDVTGGPPQQVATLLADGSVLAVGVTCGDRPDLSAAAVTLGSVVLALICLAVSVALALRGKVSWWSVAAGAALGVVTLVPAYALRAALRW